VQVQEEAQRESQQGTKMEEGEAQKAATVSVLDQEAVTKVGVNIKLILFL
jgi:hypothetical protein